MNPRAVPRVASLLPAATEIVCALVGPEPLVGVSHECDHPASVRALPALTRSRVPAAGRSGAIDAGVREVLRRALAVYEVDVEALRAADPDVIVTQDLCDVCAVSLGDVQAAVAELVRDDVRVVSLRPMRLADVWRDVRTVGAALGVAERAAEVVDELEARVERVAARARELARRAVLTIEWTDPVMVGGTWMPELVELAGGAPLVTRAGEHAPTLSKSELAALDPAPEVVLVKPCGFPLERTREERDDVRALLADLPWPAVRTNDVWIADGNAYFNRPGPRLVESLEILAACVHPDPFADLADAHAGAFERLR